MCVGTNAGTSYGWVVVYLITRPVRVIVYLSCFRGRGLHLAVCGACGYQRWYFIRLGCCVLEIPSGRGNRVLVMFQRQRPSSGGLWCTYTSLVCLAIICRHVYRLWYLGACAWKGGWCPFVNARICACAYLVFARVPTSCSGE